MVDMLYSQDENDLRSTVADFLSSKLDINKIKDLYDGDRSIVAPLWEGLIGDLGIAGILVPEELGGLGLSAKEAGVVLEELGRTAAPVPFLTSSVIATSVLLDAAATEAGTALVGELAAGEKTAALAVPWTATSFGSLAQTSGTVTSVAGALEADVLLVPVATAGGIEVRAIDVAEATMTPILSLDMTRQLAEVTVPVGAGEVVVPASAGEAAIRHALLIGAGLLASEQLGLTQWGFATTLEYAKTRRQFGRLIGSYQAIKHRFANLFVATEELGAVARYAASAIAEGEDIEIAVATAGSFAGETALKQAEETIQLHGGIGMTWEYPAHIFLKRAKADQIGLGLPGAHRAHLASLLELTA